MKFIITRASFHQQMEEDSIEKLIPAEGTSYEQVEVSIKSFFSDGLPGIELVNHHTIELSNLEDLLGLQTKLKEDLILKFPREYDRATPSLPVILIYDDWLE